MLYHRIVSDLDVYYYNYFLHNFVFQLYIAQLCDVSSFLTDAMETLVIRPQTVEEMAEDNLKYVNLHERKEGVRYCFIISNSYQKIVIAF